MVYTKNGTPLLNPQETHRKPTFPNEFARKNDF